MGPDRNNTTGQDSTQWDRNATVTAPEWLSGDIGHRDGGGGGGGNYGVGWGVSRGWGRGGGEGGGGRGEGNKSNQSRLKALGRHGMRAGVIKRRHVARSAMNLSDVIPPERLTAAPNV